MSEAIELAKKVKAVITEPQEGFVGVTFNMDMLKTFHAAAVQRGIEIALDLINEEGKLGLIKELDKREQPGVQYGY